MPDPGAGEESQAIIIWEVFAGTKKRTFQADMSGADDRQWPIFKYELTQEDVCYPCLRNFLCVVKKRNKAWFSFRMIVLSQMEQRWEILRAEVKRRFECLRNTGQYFPI